MEKTGLRDSLLAALTLVSGCVDAISYLGLGRVFTANMTGNIILLGFALARAETGAAERSAVAVGGFALGVVVAARLAGRQAKSGAWPPHVTRILAVELLALAGFGAAWQLLGQTPARLDVLIALSGVAMGMQSGAIRSVAVSGVSTTYVTGTLTALVTGLATLAGRPAGWARLTSVLLALLAGGVVGGVAVLKVPDIAAILPAAILAGIVAAAAFGLGRGLQGAAAADSPTSGGEPSHSS